MAWIFATWGLGSVAGLHWPLRFLGVVFWPRYEIDQVTSRAERERSPRPALGLKVRLGLLVIRSTEALLELGGAARHQRSGLLQLYTKVLGKCLNSLRIHRVTTVVCNMCLTTITTVAEDVVSQFVGLREMR